MRFRASLLRASALTALLVASLAPASARADEEFDVKVTPGHIEVKAKGSWHINADYPWKLTAGEKKIGKDAFKLSKTEASIDAPKGPVTVRGGVCSGEQCRMFEKKLDVP
jgi:hypothetical protein